MKVQRREGGTAQTKSHSNTGWKCDQQHVPVALPRERRVSQCTGGWVDIQAVRMARKISPPPPLGFDPRTIQHRVAIPTAQ